MNRHPLRRSNSTNIHAARQPQPWRVATELELERLRWQLLDTVRGFKVTGLDLFFSAIFSSSDMVQAYFEPRPLEVGRGNSAGQFTVTPFDASLRAANSATRYGVLLPPERGLAGVASFLHAAGLYFITSSLARENCPASTISAHEARVHCRAWLEDGLRSLRFSEPALGATLTAAMEMGDFGDSDPDQVARLITARRLANLRIEDMWLSQPEVRP
jgi:hypothetical protein